MAGFFEQLGQMFSGLAGGPDGVHARIWSDLKPWLMNLGPAATRKWIPRIASGQPCEVPIVRGGRQQGDCPNFGIAECVVCKKPTCLQHAHIDQFADAICYVCVADAAQIVPPLQRSRTREAHKAPPRDAPPPRSKSGPSPEQVLSALRVLGLRPGATLTEMRAAHRKLSALNHPDKKRTSRDKIAAEARFKEVQAAYELLVKVTQS